MDPLNHILGLEVLDILWIDSASEEPFFRLCRYWVGTEVIKISCSDTATFQRIDEPGNEVPGIGMVGTQRCFEMGRDHIDNISFSVPLNAEFVSETTTTIRSDDITSFKPANTR